MFSVLRVINLLSCTKRRNIFRGTAIIQGSKAKVIMHNPQKLLTKNNIFLPRLKIGMGYKYLQDNDIQF